MMTVSMECFAFAMLSNNWVNVRLLGVMNWKMVDKKVFDVGSADAEVVCDAMLVAELTATMMLLMMELLHDVILMVTAFGGDKTLAMIVLRAWKRKKICCHYLFSVKIILKNKTKKIFIADEDVAN